jgi:hypothetical protein
MTVNQIATRTVLAASPNPSSFGEAVTLTARVLPEEGSIAPTGTVTFAAPGGFRQAATLDGEGVARVTASTLESGTATASYAGDLVFTASAGTTELEVRATGSVTIRQLVEGSDAAFPFTSPTPALNLSVTTSGGRGESEPVTLVAGRYSVTAADMRADGYAVTEIACSDDDSIGDVPARKARIDLAAGEAVVCTFTAVNSREKTTELIEGFLKTRAELILSNQPDVQRRIDRLKGTASGGNPLAALAEASRDSAGPAPLSFATSLSSLAEWPSGRGQARFDAWVEGTYLRFDIDDAGGAGGAGGSFGLVAVGADYLVRSNLLVGGFLQVDRMEQSWDDDPATISGTGWLAGPYATARISQNIFLDVLAGLGRSSNEVSPYGTYEDDFDAARWLASATLQGEWSRGAWTFSPRLQASYFQETSRDYTDSLGVDIPEVKVGLGRIAFGPGVSHRRVVRGDVVIDTGFRLDAAADFLDTSEESGFDNLHARVEARLDATYPNGARLGFAIAQDGIGAGDLQATGGRVQISIPLE